MLNQAERNPHLIIGVFVFLIGAAMSMTGCGERRTNPGDHIEESAHDLGRDMENAVDPPSRGERIEQNVEELGRDMNKAVRGQ